jgi:hypothetical protein
MFCIFGKCTVRNVKEFVAKEGIPVCLRDVYMNRCMRFSFARVSALLLCFLVSQQFSIAQVSLSLSWTYSSTNETGFGIQRAASTNGPWTQIGTIAAPTTSYLDTGLQYSTTYFYQVWAYDAAGNSPFSSIASYTTTPAPDTTNPVVNIMTPTANEDWSNAALTVTGTAGDNVGVADVYYSLNGGGWNSATTANNWANWTANVTLVPGTNTIAAYAVDNSGNLSTTSTVSFMYVTAPLTAPLTVLINGGGTVSPNYNGVLLQIGQNYSMTATAAGGFAFTNWTGSLTTSSVTLNFTMASNLTFTANFVDVQKPTVSIVSPTANEDWSNAALTVTGTAADNVGVADVYYSLNGSSWTNASTVNEWTNWTANVTLVPGTNTIAAYAVDTSGNLSTTSTVSFIYVTAPLTAPLTVLINGSGTVSPNYNGVPLQIGQNYSMTATAVGGFAFTNWTGSLTTSSATLNFTMASNLTFTANFVDVQKPTVNIVSPTANEDWSNAALTVTGTAADNVGVADVYYSLNGSSWTNASTVNEWTNWTANVTLVPGTNTIAAYAVDTSGNVSTTNAVTFFYVTPVVGTPPSISSGPMSQTAIVGSNVTFLVVASGTAPMSYQWLFNGNNLAGQTASNLNLNSVQQNQAGDYAVIVSNLAGSATSPNAILTVHAADKSKPSVNIVTPYSNQHWRNSGSATTGRVSDDADVASNSVLTVSGKAGDKMGVADVYYSLNGAPWIKARTHNNWSNWTANVTLTPGTNTIQACAVSIGGNVSATNKVNFLYVVPEPLTVQVKLAVPGTVIPGEVSPNYNGAVLDVGVNYTIRAKAESGFAFTNWTGSLTTNGETLRFRMTTNLTFTANFVDVEKPVVSIMSPKAREHWSNSVFTVTGKASDNVGVADVYYSLNGSGWTSASTANGWTNWTANVTLALGTNTIAAYAVDTSGNVSATNKVTFTYEMVPGSLAGLMAAVTPNGESTFFICFGNDTFSQSSTDTNNFSGVGNYTYEKLGTNTAQLVLTYTDPPTLTNENASVFLTFTTNNACVFSNEDNGGDTGNINLSTAANLAPRSLNGKKTVIVNDLGEELGVSFGNGTLKITNADNSVDSGSYTFKGYSPVGVLLKVTVPGQNTNYLELTFSATNCGDFFVTAYDGSSSLPHTDYGTFGIISQSPDGNAPGSLQNLNAQVAEEGGAFNLSFDASTFSQSSTDTNFDNGAGTYIFTQISTNAGQLTLNYTTPLNGSNSVYVTFIAKDFGLFTNQDNGSNSIATISFSTATNLLQ